MENRENKPWGKKGIMTSASWVRGGAREPGFVIEFAGEKKTWGGDANGS